MFGLPLTLAAGGYETAHLHLTRSLAQHIQLMRHHAPVDACALRERWRLYTGPGYRHKRLPCCRQGMKPPLHSAPGPWAEQCARMRASCCVCCPSPAPCAK